MTFGRMSVVMFCGIWLLCAGPARSQEATTEPGTQPADRGTRGGFRGRGTPSGRSARGGQSGIPTTRQSLSITDFGAIADGKTVNTAAIQRALNLCAASPLGGEVNIPAGNFVTGSLLIGPRTTVRLDKDAILTGSADPADYPIMNVRWEGEWRPGHRALLSANNVDHIAVIGEGRIVGPPVALANLRPNRNGDARGPSIFEPIECTDVHLEGFSIQYQRMWNIHLTYCQDVVVKNVTIRSTQSNADGIDVDSSKNVLIEGCDIQTGDDAICLKSGRGNEAVRIGRPTDGVVIRNCRLSCPSFGCIGIGTELSGGVRNVRIENCTFGRAVNAIFFKSRPGRAGFIENITGDGWDVSAEVQNLVNFDLMTKGIVGTEPIEGTAGLTRVADIRLSNIRTQARNLLVVSSSSPDKPIENVALSDVTGSCQTGIVASNIANLQLTNIDVKGYGGEFLSLENVTGPGIGQIKEPKDTAAQKTP